MHHLRIGSDCGLGGRVFSVQRVMGVTDYLHSQSISHTFDIYVQKEGIRSLAAVPVVVQRKVHAVLYAGARAAVRLPNRILESLHVLRGIWSRILRYWKLLLFLLLKFQVRCKSQRGCMQSMSVLVLCGSRCVKRIRGCGC